MISFVALNDNLLIDYLPEIERNLSDVGEDYTDQQETLFLNNLR